MDLKKLLLKTDLVIFDMDGVLADTEPIYLDVEKELVRRYGKNLPSELVEKVKGTSLTESMRMITEELGINERIEKLVEEEKRMLRKRFENGKIDSIPCAFKLVDFLSRKFRLALATSTEYENAILILSKLKIEDKFDLIITGDRVKNPKPDPGIYTKVSMIMKINPENCLVIEDSINGVIASKRAGMNVVAVNVKPKLYKIFSKFTFLIFESVCEFFNELLKIRGVFDEKKDNII